MHTLVIIFSFCLFLAPFSAEAKQPTSKIELENHVKPDLVSENVWKEIQPYLLPINHPLKKKLDALFTSSRVTLNTKSIENAGFTKSIPAQFSHAIIAKNESIPGYYFKFYSDEQEIDVESKQWIDRAFEARALKEAVILHGYQKYFVVPKKWIYPIPNTPVSTGPYPKSFILIAEKIKIAKRSNNLYKWRTLPTKKLLNAIWVLTEQEGLVDSLVAHNLPFTYDNRLAFIDLEHHHHWPVPFYKLLDFLNSEMQSYWNELTKN